VYHTTAALIALSIFILYLATENFSRSRDAYHPGKRCPASNSDIHQSNQSRHHSVTAWEVTAR
jgi:hypothetical protein